MADAFSLLPLLSSILWHTGDGDLHTHSSWRVERQLASSLGWLERFSTFEPWDESERIYFNLRTTLFTPQKQAEALADDFCRLKINFDAIYTSDLTRAKLTAKTVKDKQETTAGGATDVPFVELDLLREQSFGAGEGRPFGKKEKGLSLVAHYAKGKFPALHTRQQKFPGGESLDEMALRAEAVIDGVMRLELLKEGAEGKPRTVAIFSHGLFIGELVAAITRRDVEYQGNIDIRDLRGMRNTGWTRLEVSLKPESDHASQSSDMQTYFAVWLNGVNRHGHLSNLHRQKGGIGSSTHDPAQKDIRSFLGGKQKSAPAVSNVIPRPKPY